MWYVIQTRSGNESKVCMWINTFVNKDNYSRCFVPVYEDVWRRDGIGNISINKLFPGYIFLDTSTPEKVGAELKGLPMMSQLLYIEEDGGKVFLPLYPEEEQFFDTVLSDGMLRVSYVSMDQNRRLNRVIGPLEHYKDHIVKLEVQRRRAVVGIDILGQPHRIKFCLWLDKDPKIPWIEERKKEPVQKKEQQTYRKGKAQDGEQYDFKVGDYVINTTGICGETPLEVVKINPSKKTLTVSMDLFGENVNVEMDMGDVVRDSAYHALGNSV